MANINFSNLSNEFDLITKKPENFLTIQEDKVKNIEHLMQTLYSACKKNEVHKEKPFEVLNELIINNLDEEQVWQQIELQNNVACNFFVNHISHLVSKKENLKLPLKTCHKDVINGHQSKKKVTKNKENKLEKCQIEKPKPLNKKITGKPSIVDDKFFKLYEMNEFLEQMEKDIDKKIEDDINLFESDSSMDEDSNDQLYYNDFFDQPEDEVILDKKESSNCESNKKIKKVNFALNEENENDAENFRNENLNSKATLDDDDNYSYDEDEEEEDGSCKGKEESQSKIIKEPSTFEARQEKLKLRISKLEEEALKDKPWQLNGEVTANVRPQNSLLQEYVEFDVAVRPPPVLTEKSTLKLEDIIIQRIKDKAWDDVVRKIKPLEVETEYKKKLVLDQEKSKLSLAQIYEQEYLKQLDSKNQDVLDKPEVELKEHQEIRIMMSKLFSKLDALSNFHFTPKQVEPEIKIVSNIPATTMEEVAPIATSDANLLAPEEVKAKSKGELIGKNERTATDKKRSRRKKKLMQKLKHKLEESKEKLSTSKDKDLKKFGSNKISNSLLQKLTKSSNITQLEENMNRKHIKSSKAFFSKMQDYNKNIPKKKSHAAKMKKFGGKNSLKKQ